MRRQLGKGALSAVVDALPDILAPDLRLVICGTRVGPKSVRVGHYYAGGGNGFWDAVYKVGLTPGPLHWADDRKLLEFGIGLTDLVKHTSGSDKALEVGDEDRARLRRVIEQHRPRVLAFNGKKGAQSYLERPVGYGLLEDRIGATRLFVLASTSPAARRWWDLAPWRQLAELVR